MTKKILLAMVLATSFASVSAEGAPKIVPATAISADVKIRNDPTGLTIDQVMESYPYIGIYTVPGYPTNQILKNKCSTEVKKGMKTPSMAKIPRISSAYYNKATGIYSIVGDVDSQNSYGAMLRSSFLCSMIYEGNAKFGTLWVDVFIDD